MSSLYRCTMGDERVSFDSKPDAAKAGWTFVEIVTREGVRYHVFCPAHRPAWLAQAMKLAPLVPRETKE